MKALRLIVAVASAAFLTSAVPNDKSLAKRVKTLQWFGVNQSGAEFGQHNIPGTYNQDYNFPSTATIDTLMSQGLNIFRVPFLMERIAPGSMTAPFNQAYLSMYVTFVTHITDKGGYAVVDPHNYGRYNGGVIGNTADFKTFWTNLATQFKLNDHIIFDTNNEYHDMDEALVVNLNQAAIDGIRGAGATTQYIFVEGNSYTGAWKWLQVNTDMIKLTDSQNKLIYEMHQYLDSDGSGTTDQCVSATIGSERLRDATKWLRDNGKKGVIGEFAGGDNSLCYSAVTDMLRFMGENKDVWLGGIWWGGGPWFKDYIFDMEPPAGKAYVHIMPQILGLV